MGLYAIPIRDEDAASRIPTILAEHGYDVYLVREDGSGRVFECRADFIRSSRRGGPPRFSITATLPPVFHSGIDADCQTIARILEERGVFLQNASD
jgi:hypothetical protein